MKQVKILTVLLVGCFLLAPVWVGAQELPTNKDSFYVSADQTIDKNIFQMAGSVVIDGQVNGDIFVAGNVVAINGPVSGSVFAAGNSVSIKGPVGGSVFAAGSSVDVAGEVQGSIRVAGSNVTISGKALQNISAVGSNIAIAPGSLVGWDLLVSGVNASVNGLVGRNAKLDTAYLVLGSQVGGDVEATIAPDGSLSLAEGAKIMGQLNYNSLGQNQLSKSEGATVLGETNWQKKDSAPKDKPFRVSYNPLFSFFKLASFFASIVLGLAFIYLIKKPTKQIAEKMIAKPAVSIGWGLVFFALIPFVSFLLLFTIIGIPFAFIAMVMYFIGIYIARVFIAVAFGSYLMKLINKNKESSLGLSLIVGLVVYFLLTTLPIVGWLIKLLTWWWAWGAIFMIKTDILKKIND